VNNAVVEEKLDALRDDCVRFLMDMCAVPALGPENLGTGEMEKYKFVKQFVTDMQPDVLEEYPCPDDRVPDGVRPNLAAVFKGRDESQTLWILSHLDVVPPGEAGLWNSDPFRPYIQDGHVYGRGVEDNGQAVASSIFAVKAAKETCGLSINAGLVLVADEETGSRLGLEYILNQNPALFKPGDLIVVPDAGNRDGTAIEIAEKSLLHVRFTVRGRQAHASRPDHGANTLRAAAKIITAVDEALHKKFTARNEFFNPPFSTFEPTRKDANVPNVNTIPGEDVFYFDCRVLPGENIGEILAEMKNAAEGVDKELGVSTEVAEYLCTESLHSTSPDAPVVKALALAIQEVYGVQARPEGIGGQTVAVGFRKRGLAAAVWEKILQTAHAPNERISIDNLMGNAKVFARMMTR
jgi:succinyl-diaminopimelate desuccinylase